MKTFFLGLNKHLAYKYNAIYSPIISIYPYKKNCPLIKKSFKNLHLSTHIILTSKNAANLFVKRANSISKLSNKILNKKFLFFVIGKATAAVLKKYNINSYEIAPSSTSEGIIHLLKSLTPSKHKIFYPHSVKSRDIILNYLKNRSFSFIDCPFYTTYYKKKIFPYKNSKFIFTSPSTIHSFFKYNKPLYNKNNFICIGPITEEALDKILLLEYNSIKLLLF